MRMQGRNHPGSVLSILLLTTVLGCDDGRPESSQGLNTSAADPSLLFDATTVGSLHGRVIWNGDVPVVPQFLAPINAGVEILAEKKNLLWDNPNAPLIDKKTKGVGDAVIFLRGVDPRQARPWNHPAVRVEQRDYQLHVHQGRRDSHYGFVRRGDTVEMLSKQAVFHSLHAGGAAFFTLTFPEPDRPRSRRLADNGIVELSSAAGYYWMRAYLFVDEHPYYTQTDTDGRFTLESVPPGDYEVVCWLPNWHEERHERDPESCLIIRMEFQKAAELIQKVTIRNNAVRELSFNISASDSRR